MATAKKASEKDIKLILAKLGKAQSNFSADLENAKRQFNMAMKKLRQALDERRTQKLKAELEK